MRDNILKKIDWPIIVCVIALTIIGCIELFSVTGGNDYGELKKQLIWFSISIPVTVAIIFVDYNIIAKYSPILYGIMILTLIGVLFTTPINGATSWYNIGSVSIQPSEFAKICVILCFSLTIVKVQRLGKEQISRPLNLLKCLAVVALPIMLIVKQPDFGTAVAFCVAIAIILISSGLSKKYIIGAILIVLVTVPLLYFFVLPAHAKTRIDVFLNPNIDPRGSGYNVLQSRLAIGSGKIFGMGIKNGSQTQLGYLYPQTTDFIYSAIGEEMGFVVAIGVIVLYLVLIIRALIIAKTAKDDIG